MYWTETDRKILRSIMYNGYTKIDELVRICDIPISTAYRRTRQLEAYGLIDAYTEDMGRRGRPKKIFLITEKGINMVRGKEWKNKPIEK